MTTTPTSATNSVAPAPTTPTIIYSNTARFPLGQIVATPGALELLQETGFSAAALISRHVHGSWGDLCEEDRAENEFAVSRRLRILSCYRLVDAERLAGLAGSPRHQGVAAVIDAGRSYLELDDVLETLDEPPFLLVLDGVTDPHNLGACLRVADAMGVHAVIAPKDKSAPLNATVSKVACGAAEVMPYIQVTNLARTLREMKDKGIWIVGTDMDGSSDLYHFEQTGPLAWVLGAEGHGMRRLTREYCDALVSIPMYGTVESLNVSVATGIVLAESRRQRQLLAERG